MDFEPVIGLEVHAQLLTKSKIFCSCSTRFGDPPNSNTCPVCLGLPGALPVLNREAVAMAVKTGLALDCRINRRSVFARKNYFYPDLPKGYQISQYDLPLAEQGAVTLHLESEEARQAPKTFRITRVHLEEDAGKSIHKAGDDTWVNLNRTGVPLMEIVTEADFRSPEEADAFLNYLRQVLIYLEVCDGNMEEGSLRCDANVSVRPVGTEEYGTKAEIKNLNSFRFLRKALHFEIQRQVDVLRRGGTIEQDTRQWDEDAQRTLSIRTKEEAHDYRYFPEPDLLPVAVSEDWLESLHKQIPELGEPRRERFVSEYALDSATAELLVQSRSFADYFEKAVQTFNQPGLIANWMMGDLTRNLKKHGQSIEDCPISPEQLARLVKLIHEGTISGKIAKEIFEEMYRSGEEPEAIMAQKGLQQISDQAELESIVDKIVEEHPGEVEEYRNGKTKLIGFFVGQVMRETRGQANPRLTNELLRKKLVSS